MKTDVFGPSAQEIFQLQITILQQATHIPDQHQRQDVLDYLAWNIAALIDDLVDEPHPVKQPLANPSPSASATMNVDEANLPHERLARRNIHLAELEVRIQRANLPLEERLELYVQDLAASLRTLLRLTLERQQPALQMTEGGAENG